MKIALQPWHYTCGDGCCTEYGTNVFVDGVKITEHGDLDHVLIKALLNHLGYKDVEIVGLDENGEESWGV